MESQLVNMTEDHLLSKYSLRYQDLSQEQFDATLVKTESGIEQFRTRLDLELIEQFIKGPDVVDFPIGPGRLYPNFLDRFNVYGYDISESFVNRAKQLYPQFADRFEVHALETFESTRQFDTVLTFRVIDHLNHPELVVSNIRRILKPGARWIVTHGKGDFAETIKAGGFDLIFKKRYDIHPYHGQLGPVGSRLWKFLPGLIKRGLVPYSAYRFLDGLVPSLGAHFFVADKIG